MEYLNSSQYTEKIIQELKLDISNKIFYLWKWFYNPSDIDNIRLSSEGFKLFKNILKLNSVEVKVEKPITNKSLLLLKRHIHYPYFYQNSKLLHFFGSEDSLMLTLNGNNLEHYLNSLNF